MNQPTFTPMPNDIVTQINEVYEMLKNEKEQTLAKLIEENDFICGSKKVLGQLQQAFPNMNVKYFPHLRDENKVIMIKKFNLMDLLKESEETE